jgi:hypothetical protein
MKKTTRWAMFMVIKTSFLSAFFMQNKRQPEAEGTIEADMIIYKRTAELMDSIKFQ